jgi:outer membrane protein assembly factor BamB
VRPSTRRRLLAGLAVAIVWVELVVLQAGHVASQGPKAPSAIPIAALPTIPPETEQFANDWPVPQGNLAATRSAAHSTISSATIARLEVAWTFDLPAVSAYGSVTANPIVVGDAVYIQDMQSNVFALDRATGALRWKAEYHVESAGPNGVAVGYGMVFATLGDTGEVVALDSGSGRQVWRRQVGSPPGEGIDMAPIAYGGLVYVSTVPGTSGNDNFYLGGDRGILYALDAINGQVAWWFDTTNGGWGASRVAGGGGLWYPPSFDAAGNLYFGVGNPGPFPLTPNCPNGACRPGDNAYTDSMVSLDGKTGGVRWSYQDRKHDLLGLDFQHTPILTTVGGTPVAIGSGKTGNVVAVNADSGAVLWKTPVGKHQNDDVAELPSNGFLEVYPGDFGGVESPIAYANGSVFATYVDFPQAQGATGEGPNLGAFATATGGLVAIDADDGSVRWEAKIDALVVGGATVANDVVFTNGLDGFLRAFHADTGVELWHREGASGYNAPPAIAGDMLFVGAGFVKLPRAGAAPVIIPEGQAAPGSKLMAFRIR